MGGPKPDEFVDGFIARLADFNHGEYLVSEVARARAEGRAEAHGVALSTRPIALTEEGLEPAGIVLERILGHIRKTNGLGTRIRISVEIVHREPGERGGPEDL